MSRSLASKIEAANAALITDGNMEAVGEFFSPDYVAHLTDQDLTGGHEEIRGFVAMYRRAFPDLQVRVEILVEVVDFHSSRHTMQPRRRRVIPTSLVLRANAPTRWRAG